MPSHDRIWVRNLIAHKYIGVQSWILQNISPVPLVACHVIQRWLVVFGDFVFWWDSPLVQAVRTRCTNIASVHVLSRVRGTTHHNQISTLLMVLLFFAGVAGGVVVGQQGSSLTPTQPSLCLRHGLQRTIYLHGMNFHTTHAAPPAIIDHPLTSKPCTTLKSYRTPGPSV